MFLGRGAVSLPKKRKVLEISIPVIAVVNCGEMMVRCCLSVRSLEAVAGSLGNVWLETYLSERDIILHVSGPLKREEDQSKNRRDGKEKERQTVGFIDGVRQCPMMVSITDRWLLILSPNHLLIFNSQLMYQGDTPRMIY